MPEWEVDEQYVSVKVNLMGWSWCVFVAQSCLSDVVADRLSRESCTALHGRTCPQLYEFDRLHWLYADDYAGIRLEPKETPERELLVGQDAAEVRSAVKAKGFRVHKEAWGRGLERSLGMTITEDFEAAIEEGVGEIRSRGIASAGAHLVIVAGMPFGIAGTTNSIRVSTL